VKLHHNFTTINLSPYLDKCCHIAWIPKSGGMVMRTHSCVPLGRVHTMVYHIIRVLDDPVQSDIGHQPSSKHFTNEVLTWRWFETHVDEINDLKFMKMKLTNVEQIQWLLCYFNKFKTNMKDDYKFKIKLSIYFSLFSPYTK
jgi:hypothetical protein